MCAQGCCEGFCDDHHIAGRNNPDMRSDLSKQEARKRPERALLRGVGGPRGSSVVVATKSVKAFISRSSKSDGS